jgi:hypothetical protein
LALEQDAEFMAFTDFAMFSDFGFDLAVDKCRKKGFAGWASSIDTYLAVIDETAKLGLGPKAA